MNNQKDINLDALKNGAIELTDDEIENIFGGSGGEDLSAGSKREALFKKGDRVRAIAGILCGKGCKWYGGVPFYVVQLDDEPTRPRMSPEHYFERC